MGTRGAYDFIIVGAGAAGCVLAERLSRNRRMQVLLVEAGGPVFNPLFYAPKGFFLTLGKPRQTYQYITRPYGQYEPIEPWIRGKAEGGSTVINGMLYARGRPGDYDILGAENPGWSWEHMLPIFRALENHPLGPTAEHGDGGPLTITYPSTDDAVDRACRAAAASNGLPVVADVDSADGEAIGPVASTICSGLRVSAATAFLIRARRRSNLTIKSWSRVGHLLLDGSRCTGVRVRQRQQQHDYTAKCEVILAAGAVESPLLLERSGIGNAKILHNAGVPLRQESPSVGDRLVEQRAMTLKLRLKDGLGHNTKFNSRPKQLWQAAKYIARRQGPISDGPYSLRASIRTHSSLELPNAEILLTAMSTNSTSDAVAAHAGMTIKGYALRPSTTSSVHSIGPEPQTPPVINASFLKTDDDRHAAAALLRRQRDLAATEPLAGLVRDEEAPGARIQADEQAVDYALASGAGLYHAVGSCAMGPREDDVTDHRLRVRGVPGLRIADASIFPTPPSAAVAAPVMAAAWKAADILTEETG